MVVFGGIGSGTFPIPVPLNDVWTLSLAGSPAWTQLVPSGTLPVGRTRHTAIYDPVRDRMVAFGGSSSTVDLNDVWALALAGSPMWTKLAPAGTLPAVRAEHTAIYDPVRDRMVVFGGDSNHGKEVWALSLAGGTAWSALASAGTLPNNFLGHTAIYDPVRDRMVAYGTFTENPVWALRWTPSLSVPGDGVSRLFELAPPQPNPSRGETTVEFDLGAPGRVVLDVFDAQGRRVKRIADEWFAAGRHTSAWRGDDERGHALGSGVYFIRMQVGRVEVTRHTVRVR
jgi:hypothetical protein